MRGPYGIRYGERLIFSRKTAEGTTVGFRRIYRAGKDIGNAVFWGETEIRHCLGDNSARAEVERIASGGEIHPAIHCQLCGAKRASYAERICFVCRQDGRTEPTPFMQRWLAGTFQEN